MLPYYPSWLLPEALFCVAVVFHIVVDTASVTVVLGILGLRRKSSFQISGSVRFHILVQICLIDLDRHIIGGIFSIGLFEIRCGFFVGIHGKGNLSSEEITACIHGKIFSKCLAVCHGILVFSRLQLCSSPVGQDILTKAFAYFIAVQSFREAIHRILIFAKTQACDTCPR